MEEQRGTTRLAYLLLGSLTLVLLLLVRSTPAERGLGLRIRRNRTDHTGTPCFRNENASTETLSDCAAYLP